MSFNSTKGDTIGKLHRASCIVAHVANALVESDDVLPGETLRAAEELIEDALQELSDAGITFKTELKAVG